MNTKKIRGKQEEKSMKIVIKTRKEMIIREMNERYSIMKNIEKYW